MRHDARLPPPASRLPPPPKEDDDGSSEDEEADSAPKVTAEAGIIHKIYCENFMNHKKLSVDFCRNINFIHGQVLCGWAWALTKRRGGRCPVLPSA